MIVLGINDGHDAGACLFRNGELLLCSVEERRLNQKGFAGVPSKSIRTVFERTGVKPADVSLIALSSKIRTIIPSHKPRISLRGLQFLWRLGRTQWGTKFGRWLLPKFRKMKELESVFTEVGITNAEVRAFDHHACHAATAYYHRPWSDDATVLTLDGAGDGICSTVSTGREFQLKEHSFTPKFHSPAAWFYSAITAHLGLKPYEHEYKVMGMAPYGQAEHCLEILRNAFRVDGLRFVNRVGRIGNGMQRWMHKNLYMQRFDNVSAACQQVFEELITRWVENAVAFTGIKKVVGAGGAFLNVKANKLIRELPCVDSFYVYPASDDSGTPIGAGILGYLCLCEEKKEPNTLKLPKTMYLGLEYTEDEMFSAAKKSEFPFSKMENPCDEIGDLLSRGKIVACFNGKEELGPRALGNRSILADPRNLAVIQKLNFAIKKRDFWMPFAASVLEEDAKNYIEGITPWAFYMIEAFDTTNEGAEKLAAGTHPFDRTIRPQIVNDMNPFYQGIIRAFRKRTGVGGILNTSFNLHGFPIVGSPEIAIDTFRRSRLDALVLGNTLLTKKT